MSCDSRRNKERRKRQSTIHENMEETYKIHVFGVHNEADRPNRATRLKLAYRPLYGHAERTGIYPYSEAENKRDDNRAFMLEIKKGQMLNIPPIRLTNANKIKPKDRKLIDAYFRDFNKDSREHAKALERKREKKKALETLGRRTGLRSQVNALNLTMETLTNEREELEYYYQKHSIGQIINEVLNNGNIYG